jgi:hypothetical protein
VQAAADVEGDPHALARTLMLTDRAAERATGIAAARVGAEQDDVLR